MPGGITIQTPRCSYTAIQMYFENDKRVRVFDNFNKFVWFQFGKNLVVTHHGDKINGARLYESITKISAELRPELCRYRSPRISEKNGVSQIMSMLG